MMQKNNTDWIFKLLKLKQSYINPINLTPEFESSLKDLKEYLLPGDNDVADIFPIADESQSSFIIRKVNNSAIFFDIGQSLIHKSAFSALYSEDSQSTLFKLLLSSASLHISKIDEFFTDKLGDCQTQFYSEPTGVDSETLNKARGTIDKYLSPKYQLMYNHIFDSSILAHETYHYNLKSKGDIPLIKILIENNYNQFVDTVYNDQSLMPLDHLPKRVKAKLERERRSRREFYQKNRNHISEELACDLYAMSISLRFISNNTVYNSKYDLVKDFLALHSIMFNLHLLHLAFLERALFYQKNSAEEDYPESMSLYNLRRVSVNVLSCYMVANQLSNNKKKQDEISKELQLFLNNIYVEIANDFLIPTLMRLKACFDLIEDHFPMRRNEEAIPINDKDRRMFLSALPLRLNPIIVNQMITSF